MRKLGFLAIVVVAMIQVACALESPRAAIGGGFQRLRAGVSGDDASPPPSKTPTWTPATPHHRAVDDRDLTTRKLSRLLNDAELAARVMRWCLILAGGATRCLYRRATEAISPIFYRTVAIIEVRGVIVDERGHAVEALTLNCVDAARTMASRDGIVSAKRVEHALSRAFRCRRLRAVVLKISSPGGTASESALMHRRIDALKRHVQSKNRRKKRSTQDAVRPEVIAWIDDVCTSGGYYAACAADVVWAAPCALIGSIGVISRSFGYAKQLRMLGVERRVLASGNAKAGLDPFLPVGKDVEARERKVLEDLHAEFVRAVEASRGSKLDPKLAADIAAKADAHAFPYTSRGWVAQIQPLRYVTRATRAKRGDGLFDGSVHAARTAKDLGLIDAVCEDHLMETLKRRYGRVRVKRFRV